MLPLISVKIALEQDVVAARRRARQLATLLQFDNQDCTRIATAVSEIARNAFGYAGGGKAEFLIDTAAPQSLLIRISDQGPGIPNLSQILSVRYRSTTGMGLGLIGARRLVDELSVETASGKGTTVLLRKRLPASLPPADARSAAEVAASLARQPQEFLEEVRQQNQELISALEQLRERQEELKRLNQELAETNRGVLALYAELDERASHLRRANESKSRFLSHMSHEFRTPLNAIIGLTRLLLNRTEVTRSDEELKQIHYIRKSAEELAEVVNDQLDLAKAEAGKLTVQVSEFTASEVLAGVRGIFRPLITTEAVALICEEAVPSPPLHSDEKKLGQILRNFVSNALKFTERGSVHVVSEYRPVSDTVRFSVQDTGIGIAAEHLSDIFEEFTQIDSARQRQVQGTGLGLPLCKKLAELLGGMVEVSSEAGRGSTFVVEVPRRYGQEVESARRNGTILLIDDEEVARYLLKQMVRGAGQIREAASGADGLRQARSAPPDAILLDLNMPDMSGYEVLRELKADASTAHIPVVLVTSQRLTPAMRDQLAAQTAAIISKDALASVDAIEIEPGPPWSIEVRPAHDGRER